ncbi:conserved hypothetical protein [Shewanella halifaxensis HAW-EB4]|uniref:DUF3450 domain-containing protein n=1 Tax=Shewanella halifaxensis (strain HAW-EB4) TaxID=458817 RepID=B0TU49_SHEHH|nr:DUF3450 domain-containing protein [Shewanella halifaxensis]ABZ78160.1 conserved hypothetical protein [Shewanella halifaxensis HAW-EB4]
MIGRIYYGLLTLCCVLPLAAYASEANDGKQPTANLAQQWLEQIKLPVVKSVQLGEEAAAWQQQKAQSLSQQQQDLGELYWTEYQVQKQQRYLASLQAEVAQLQQDIATITALKQELEPQLEIWYATLERQVSADLPFDYDERKRRLAFLRSAMDSNELPLAERFRRMLDVITIEVAYGYSQQVAQEIIVIDELPVQVNLLRLGRLSWFYMTPDEQQLGWFDSQSRQWRALPVNEQGDLRLAMAITSNKQVAQIVNLPLGAQQ